MLVFSDWLYVAKTNFAIFDYHSSMGFQDRRQNSWRLCVVVVGDPLVRGGLTRARKVDDENVRGGGRSGECNDSEGGLHDAKSGGKEVGGVV